MKHHFESKARWQGSFGGEGSLKARGLETNFTVPTELRGKGTGTNPEELLLGAASSCFLITLGIVLGFQNIEVKEILLVSELEVEFDKALSAKSLTHRPTVIVERAITPEIAQTIAASVRRAEEQCFIARALKGNVAVSVATPIVERFV